MIPELFFSEIEQLTREGIKNANLDFRLELYSSSLRLRCWIAARMGEGEYKGVISTDIFDLPDIEAGRHRPLVIARELKEGILHILAREIFSSGEKP